MQVGWVWQIPLPVSLRHSWRVFRTGCSFLGHTNTTQLLRTWQADEPPPSLIYTTVTVKLFIISVIFYLITTSWLFQSHRRFMDISSCGLYSQEPGTYAKTQLLQRKTGIGLNVALGWFLSKKNPRQGGSTVSRCMFVGAWSISDWLNIQHSGFLYLAADFTLKFQLHRQWRVVGELRVHPQMDNTINSLSHFSLGS